MNEELIRYQLEKHETRLNDHSKRLDLHDQNQSRQEVQLQNLVTSIDGLIQTLKWFTGIVITALGGFFLYAIQNNIF